MLAVKSKNLKAAVPEATDARPAEICRALLDALAASDGRRKRHQRNTTPDAIGMAIKRAMGVAILEQPSIEIVCSWIVLHRSLEHSAGVPAGALGATALQILEERRMAQTLPQSRQGLDQGSQSEDKQ